MYEPQTTYPEQMKVLGPTCDCGNAHCVNCNPRTNYPTEKMIEAGAKAAWVAYTGRDGSEEWNPDTWPETLLYPDADDFRECAKACFIAMMENDDACK